jgi:hypothetical protein
MVPLKKPAMAAMSGRLKTNEGIRLENGVGKHVVGDKGIILGRDDESWDRDAREPISSGALFVLVCGISISSVWSGIDLVKLPHGPYAREA